MQLDDVEIGPIYAPYSLTDFQKCPRLYDLKKRWQSKDQGQMTAMLVGNAVAHGLEMHYLDCATGPVPLRPVEFAESYVRERYQPDSDRSEEGVMTLVRRGVKHGMTTDLGLGKILGVEKSYGRIKPDLVMRDRDGKLCVVDHKVKMSLDDRYKHNELLGFDVSNQMWHYAWAVGQEYGEVVDRVMIHLIVLAPRVYTEIHPIKIDQERLVLWLQDAARDWEDMAKEENRGRYGSCLSKYGKCEMWNGCHVFHVDESKFPVLYDPKSW